MKRNVAKLLDEVKEYEIVSVLNPEPGKEVQKFNARRPEDRHEYVTLGLKPKGDTHLLMVGNVDPFMVVSARNATGRAVVEKIKSLKDPNGKYDVNKIGEARFVRGVFKRWSVEGHMQFERGANGEIKIREYGPDSPDKALPMLSETVTAFVFEQDLESIDTILAGMIPPEAKLVYEEAKDYKYSSNVAQSIVGKIKANTDKEEVIETQQIADI